MYDFYYPIGISNGEYATAAVCLSNQDGYVLEGSIIVDLVTDEELRGICIDWPPISINSFSNDLMIFGSMGEILLYTGEEILNLDYSFEQIGPDNYGLIREVRVIEGEYFAVGMSRQVYRIGKNYIWQRFDNGILDTSCNDRVTGFNSIDGVGGNYFAVGYNGEIGCFCDGSWSLYDSPTNLLLNTIVCKDSNLYYCGGVSGIILKWNGVGWIKLENSDFDINVWSLAWFMDNLYIGTNEGLFILDENEKVIPVHMHSIKQLRFTSLSVGYGYLWCFGDEHITYTSDGKNWCEYKASGIISIK